jgi:sec-independent protein translocase protein TatA
MFRNPVTDLIIALVVVLVIFGPKRLPALGRGLGQGMKEFRDSITGKSGPIEDEEGDKPALTASGSGQAAGPATTSAEPGPAEVGSTEPRS